MSSSRVNSLKIKAKLLQKAKTRAGKPIALKDAFAIIARNAGYESWRELKAALDEHEKLRPPGSSAYWHNWFGSYEEAKAHWSEHGGFLVPYQKHYFVCDENYVAHLGLSLDDPDVQKVGRNWAEPSNTAAWTRLLGKLPQAE